MTSNYGEQAVASTCVGLAFPMNAPNAIIAAAAANVPVHSFAIQFSSAEAAGSGGYANHSWLAVHEVSSAQFKSSGKSRTTRCSTPQATCQHQTVVGNVHRSGGQRQHTCMIVESAGMSGGAFTWERPPRMRTPSLRDTLRGPVKRQLRGHDCQCSSAGRQRPAERTPVQPFRRAYRMRHPLLVFLRKT